MSKRHIAIGLIVLAVAGAVLGLARSQRGEFADVNGPDESNGYTARELRRPELMAVGDLISRLLTEEYQKSVEGKEPDIKPGTVVRVLGRVDDLRVTGQYPHLMGQVDLKPYYCSRRVQCVFWGEAAVHLENLRIDMDVIIEGTYGGIEHFVFGRDICRLTNSSLLSIERPQNWIASTSEELTRDIMRSEQLVNMQSSFRKEDTVRIFGPVYSVSVEWSYLEGLWGEVLVSRRGDLGVQCRFDGEEFYKVMRLPEGQEVVIEGLYSHGSASRASVYNCSLVHP